LLLSGPNNTKKRVRLQGRAADQSAVDVVLTGTGNPEHLKANIGAILKPALPQQALRRLEELFGRLDRLTGN
jgi:aryl-alcohol dehydrogenase-like predicted oxidoreductase